MCSEAVWERMGDRQEPDKEEMPPARLSLRTSEWFADYDFAVPDKELG
jgi:hypothetical protein